MQPVQPATPSPLTVPTEMRPCPGFYARILCHRPPHYGTDCTVAGYGRQHGLTVVNQYPFSDRPYSRYSTYFSIKTGPYTLELKVYLDTDQTARAVAMRQQTVSVRTDKSTVWRFPDLPPCRVLPWLWTVAVAMERISRAPPCYPAMVRLLQYRGLSRPVGGYGPVRGHRKRHRREKAPRVTVRNGRNGHTLPPAGTPLTSTTTNHAGQRPAVSV